MSYIDKARAHQLFNIFIAEANSDQLQSLFRHFKLDEYNSHQGDFDFSGLQ